jgi:hypothetical protein
VAAYLASQAATSKPSTLGRRVAAIRYAHKLASLAQPTDAEGVKATMRGIRRTFGRARNKKTPAVSFYLWRIIAKKLPRELMCKFLREPRDAKLI